MPDYRPKGLARGATNMALREMRSARERSDTALRLAAKRNRTSGKAQLNSLPGRKRAVTDCAHGALAVVASRDYRKSAILTHVVCEDSGIVELSHLTFEWSKAADGPGWHADDLCDLQRHLLERLVERTRSLDVIGMTRQIGLECGGWLLAIAPLHPERIALPFDDGVLVGDWDVHNPSPLLRTFISGRTKGDAFNVRLKALRSALPPLKAPTLTMPSIATGEAVCSAMRAFKED